MTAIELLISKYEKRKLSQIEAKKQTSLDYVAQHTLLDQNIHLFEGIIEDLNELGGLTQNEGKLFLHGVSRSELDLCRQWFNAVQDLNSEFLEKADYELAQRIMNRLGMKVPKSVSQHCD